MFIKRLILAIISFVILTATIAHSQTNSGGLGAYAALAPNWPCDSMMQGYAGMPALRLSILWHTFGRNFNCIDKWANDPRPKILETHLINEVCQRNGRCGNYELLKPYSVQQYNQLLLQNNAGLLTSIKANIQPMADWYGSHTNVECRLSGGLESNLSFQAYQNLITALRPIFRSDCQWVWNPLKINKQSGFIQEGHSNNPPISPVCIANLDGMDIALKARPAIAPSSMSWTEVSTFLNKYANCDGAYLWISEFNGNRPGGFIDPRSRNNWPTLKVFQELNSYLKAAPDVVPPWDSNDELGKQNCSKFLNINDGYKKDFLWKQSDPPVLGRGAVVFLPTQYNNNTFQLQDVLVKKGPLIVARAYEQKSYTEDGSNRHFFRFHKLAQDFPYNIVAHFGNICAVIPNPHARID